MKKTPSSEVQVSFSRSKLAQESGGLYKALVRASPDAITITDLEGTIIEASNKALELYGMTSGKTSSGRTHSI